MKYIVIFIYKQCTHIVSQIYVQLVMPNLLLYILIYCNVRTCKNKNDYFCEICVSLFKIIRTRLVQQTK